jgi:1-acyl-sn-glycerol-3-phosphate acyltransferase
MADPIGAVGRAGLERLVRGNLRGVWLRGTLPAPPFVWAANHHSWWDPFIASAALGGGRAACLMMDQENLARFRFARRLGVFGSREPRAGLRYLAEGRVLVLFPEGELRPAGPLAPLADGASWYAMKAGVALAAVAVRVAARGHQAPEAYLSAVTVPTGDPVGETTRHLAEHLDHELSTLDGELTRSDPRAPLPGFRCVVPGKRSWDERLARQPV